MGQDFYACMDAVFEVAVIAVVWDDTRREEMFAHHNLEEDSQFGYHFLICRAVLSIKCDMAFYWAFLLVLIVYMILKRSISENREAMKNTTCPI